MSNIINKIRLSGTDYTLSATTSGITSGEVQTMIDESISGFTERFAEDEEVTAAALNDLNERISGISGNNVVELTQAEYDALVSGGTVDPTAFYIITDATAVDLTQYWTSAQTNSAINAAVSGKQDTLSAGTNITISGNVISAEGGGKAIEAGRGISVTTGATADTVSFNLPISAGTNNGLVFIDTTSSVGGNGCVAIGRYCSAIGNNSFAQGYHTKASSYNSHTEGEETVASGNNSHSEGYYVYATNANEHSQGKYNVSNKASTTFGDSGNTLFSVGNGTGANARHNAFEIRQNGDIYLTLNGQDVKLQDQLGGGSITVDTALDSGSTNPVENRVIYNKIDEIEEVTAAGLNAVNDKFDGLKLKKLTQAAYDALVTKDASTLYIIVN